MRLSEKAILVDLNITQWSARRYDYKATQEILEKHGARWTSGKFNKLLVDIWSIKKVQRAANDARTFHYANTLPWDDGGSRLLPSENYFKYTQKMRQYESAFKAAVEDFTLEYPELIERAKKDLGSLFNQFDYPHLSIVKEKFSFHIQVSCLEEAEDFRVSLEDEDVRAIQKEITERVSSQVKTAVEDLWTRLSEALGHLVEKLRDKDAIFRDSLVGNISELTDVLPRLNITGDKDLANIINEARVKLASLEPKELREDDKKRADAAKVADEILAKMAGYTGGPR
jgi:hypothetical protein